MTLTRHDVETTLTATHPDLRGLDLSGLNLSDLDFTNADMRDTRLTGTDLTRATFTGARMDRADATGAHLIDTWLTSPQLRSMFLGHAVLRLTRPEPAPAPPLLRHALATLRRTIRHHL